VKASFKLFLTNVFLKAGPIERHRLETLLNRVSLLEDENPSQNIVWIPDTKEEKNLPITRKF
jgi:hypothetical protein